MEKVEARLPIASNGFLECLTSDPVFPVDYRSFPNPQASARDRRFACPSRKYPETPLGSPSHGEFKIRFRLVALNGNRFPSRGQSA